MPDRTALLLAPGPSLTRSWRAPPWPSPINYHVALAVNEAIALAPSRSWWVAADYQVIERVSPPRFCWLCTAGRSATELGCTPPCSFEHFGLDETAYSAIAALHLAHSFGCRQIVTYGVDLAGDRHHFDQPGDDSAKGCNADRWAKERAQWQQTLQQLDLEWLPAK